MTRYLGAISLLHFLTNAALTKLPFSQPVLVNSLCQPNTMCSEVVLPSNDHMGICHFLRYDFVADSSEIWVYILPGKSKKG